MTDSGLDWDETWALPRDEATLVLGPGLVFTRESNDGTLWRWTPSDADVGADAEPRLVRLPPGRLSLVPALPPEPLVLRFAAPLDLTPGGGPADGPAGATTDVFVGLPVDIRVDHTAPGAERSHPVALARAPGLRRRLAVGRVEEPLLARAVDVALHPTSGAVGAGLAVMPLRFRPSEGAVRALDRILLPAGSVSLWAGRGVLCASAVEVDLRPADEAVVRVLAEVPRADVRLRFGPPQSTGEFSLRGLVRALTQFTLGAE